MHNIFFFQTQTIPDDSNLFHQFKKQKISYSYFLVNQNYYLFFYAQEPIQLDFIYQSIDLIQELDSKQRKIRSLRGFFLYALETIQNADNYEILKTNLQPFFWKKVHNIIRQNKKGALQEFLFGKDTDTKYHTTGSNPALQELQNQVDSLAQQVEKLRTALRFGQQKVIQLEYKLENPKYALSESSQPLKSSKTIQQENYTLRGKKALYLTENEPKRSAVSRRDSEVRNTTSQTKYIESKTVSGDPKIHFKAPLPSEEYNIPLKSEKGPNEQNFIILSKISEEERVEIIKLGFQLNQQGKISLKKYYETIQEYSLFQLKGYNIKYEAIRKNKLYQQLKEKIISEK